MCVEQVTRDCQGCQRRFAVRYGFSAPRRPEVGSERIALRELSCPFCHHVNPTFLLMDAHDVVVMPAGRVPRRRIMTRVMSVAAQLVRRMA
jgi:hypothetical protein